MIIKRTIESEYRILITDFYGNVIEILNKYETKDEAVKHFDEYTYLLDDTSHILTIVYHEEILSEETTTYLHLE